MALDQKSKYKTRQRELLIEHLKTRPGTHFTAADICDYFKSQNLSIGQSTVYRQLEQLVGEGLINKYIFDPNSPACFEYIGSEVHQDGEACFHCKCEKCGKLIHLHCEELEAIQTHLYQEHRFTLDPFRTVFYGLCDDCAEASQRSR